MSKTEEKGATAAPATKNEPAGKPEPKVTLVALSTFECKEAEGRIEAGQTFETSQARADYLTRWKIAKAA